MLQLTPLFPIHISGTLCWNCPMIPGRLLSPKSYVDVPAGHRKSDYLYTNFLPNFTPINIPFLKEKHPILIKLGAFYNIWTKIHPIYVMWTPSSLMKTPRSLYQILRKSAPKGRHIYVYYVNVRTPPPGPWYSAVATDPWIYLTSCFKTFTALKLHVCGTSKPGKNQAGRWPFQMKSTLVRPFVSNMIS